MHSLETIIKYDTLLEYCFVKRAGLVERKFGYCTRNGLVDDALYVNRHANLNVMLPAMYIDTVNMHQPILFLSSRPPSALTEPPKELTVQANGCLSCPCTQPQSGNSAV